MPRVAIESFRDERALSEYVTPLIEKSFVDDPRSSKKKKE